MELLTNLHIIILRALEISLTVISPVSVLFYVTLVVLVALAYRRGPRLGTFVHIMAMVFFFFVIWNHPAYAWYKRNPWNGGYVYAAVMIVVYMFLPLKAGAIAYRLYRRRHRRE